MSYRIICYCNIFYRSLNTVNKGVVDQLIQGGIMRQPFDIASALLDEMTKINHACGSKAVNAVGINSGVTHDEAHFKAMYNEEVQFLANQVENLTFGRNRRFGELRPTQQITERLGKSLRGSVSPMWITILT
ncbi:hypothetical protein MTR67_030747, partial [Solanum verrucosum]